jgi:hypothetical protein
MFEFGAPVAAPSLSIGVQVRNSEIVDRKTEEREIRTGFEELLSNEQIARYEERYTWIRCSSGIYQVICFS